MNVSGFDNSIKAMQEGGARLENTLDANMQEASSEKLATEEQENSVSGMVAKDKKLAPERKKTETEKKVERAQDSIFVRKDPSDLAESFTKRDGNKDYLLSKQSLVALANELGINISGSSDYETIISLITQKLTIKDPVTTKMIPPNPGQVDKALDFLIEYAIGNLEFTDSQEKDKLVLQLKSCKEQYTAQFALDIKIAAKAVSEISIEQVSKETGLSGSEVLEKSHDLIYTPRGVQDLRKMYESKGGYVQAEKDALGFFSSVGRNLKRVVINYYEPNASNDINAPR